MRVLFRLYSLNITEEPEGPKRAKKDCEFNDVPTGSGLQKGLAAVPKDLAPWEQIAAALVAVGPTEWQLAAEEAQLVVPTAPTVGQQPLEGVPPQACHQEATS